MTSSSLPVHRWQHFSPSATLVAQISTATQLPTLVAQVLVNRGTLTPEQAQVFLEPELAQLPLPLQEIPDLARSVDLLATVIDRRQKIAICGDYDADGMTSTALLLRALRHLGATVDYAIPSRMHEGYGINCRIVEEFAEDNVKLILTVDNGIAAVGPITRAKELGLAVIVTDHHELPPELPPADAILNPKLLPETSMYRGLAGVGVAYVLAISLAQHLGQHRGLSQPLLELFTLGTIADLAPLTGVNRRWVKRGLRLLPQSQLAGVQALIQVAGLAGKIEAKSFKPEDIGFRLGPRINAVGRLADPQIVIELLTTNNPGIALERAMQCEAINQQRQQLCTQIEQAAIQSVENQGADLKTNGVLVLVEPDWHHGVIGIVASRLVERYGVPVFIGTYEPGGEMIRGSARGIPEFHIFEAMEFCKGSLEKYGGHRAAGGFSLKVENLATFRSSLQLFARSCLHPELLQPLLRVDAQAQLEDMSVLLSQQLEQLHPCGIENPDPIFWTANVTVVAQQRLGKQQDHLKLTLSGPLGPSGSQTKVQAIAWRWGEYYPLPKKIDIAYRLRVQEWNGETQLQLELVGVRRCH
jgi:single-stranded-DNA-specific exonuclease